ncbi:MAG: hypothetical protein M1155_02640 [Patescibacteria group bacterium]|nr:hypothetical protein [Patescibacteria group bacterium]
MDPEKEKMIKEAVLKVCRQQNIPQKEMAQRVSDELATKDEISAVIAKMIDYGELSMTTAWEIKIPEKMKKEEVL